LLALYRSLQLSTVMPTMVSCVKRDVKPYALTQSLPQYPVVVYPFVKKVKPKSTSAHVALTVSSS